jgi:spore germination protein
MEIYTVQPGDTIDKIANQYGIPVEKLIIDNGLTDPNNLVPGEIIVIVYPSQTYKVFEGDTLDSIAAFHNITVNELLRNNPFLTEREYIYPGEVLTINYDRIGSIATYGYTNTFINRQTLKKTLPYLTYISIFNYTIDENGNAIGSDDDIDIIQMAKEYGVIPLMHLAALTIQGNINLEFNNYVLTNENLQNKLFTNVINILKDKGYNGIIISAQYITAENQAYYYNYTNKLSDQLRREGFLLFIAINPMISMLNDKVTYENIDYSNISKIVDSVIIMQYKWAFNNMPPSPVLSLSNLNVFLNHALSQVGPEHLIIGIPTFGYMWELPFVSGFSSSNILTRDNAINLARNVGVTIQFDEVSQTPYFIYNDKSNNNIQYIVWFVNGITINSLLRLLLEKSITKTGVWNIMFYFTHLWLVMNSQYKIIKLLPEF